MNNDPEHYFQKLQSIAIDQDKAKLTTLAVEFGSVLQHLPTVRAEIDHFLSTDQALDYIGLVSRLEPQLEQAAAFLNEVDFLAADLQDEPEICSFIQTAKNQLTLRTSEQVNTRFQTLCQQVQKAKQQYAKKVAKEKAAAERKAKEQQRLRAKQMAKEKAAAERKAKEQQRLKAEQIAKEKAVAERKAKEQQRLKAKQIAKEKAAAKRKAKEQQWLKAAIPNEMLSIPAGQFTMGCVNGRDDIEGDCYSNESPAHSVNVAAFLLAKYPVRFAEFDAYCQLTGTKKPSDQDWGRGQHPVINVSWQDVQQYIRWLKEVTGQLWRLPCEAEWEYAARGGNNATAYPWGQSADADKANYGGALGRTTPVGQYPANGFGLYDMHGNVWEWCQDIFHNGYKGAPNKAVVWAGGNGYRVWRGGSWNYDAWYLRSAYRYGNTPALRYNHLGFRVALGQV